RGSVPWPPRRSTARRPTASVSFARDAASRAEREFLEGVAIGGRESAADRERPRHLRDVDRRLAVDGEAMRRGEAAGPGRLRRAPARQQLPVAVEDAYAPVLWLLRHAVASRDL